MSAIEKRDEEEGTTTEEEEENATCPFPPDSAFPAAAPQAPDTSQDEILARKLSMKINQVIDVLDTSRSCATVSLSFFI
jgi:hypothetical protein